MGKRDHLSHPARSKRKKPAPPPVTKVDAVATQVDGEQLDPGMERATEPPPAPPIDPIRTVMVAVYLSEQAVALVEDLVATGLYGTQREEACERLICEMLAEKYPKAFKSLGVRLR